MKTRNTILVIMTFLAALTALSQSNVHMPMSGEKLTLSLIKGFPSMSLAGDTLCDFSKCVVGKTIERKFIRKTDSTFYETERGRSRLLQAKNDTLLILSDGRPGYNIKASFPRHYAYLHGRSSRQGYFDNYGTGGSDVRIRHYGLWTEHVKDSQTIVTPEGDTLSNVVLMQSSLISGFMCLTDPADTLFRAQIDLEQHDFLDDSIRMNALVSYFYTNDCRYPLIQTEEYAMYSSGILVDSLSVGYYYPYDMQIAEIGLIDDNSQEIGTKQKSVRGFASNIDSSKESALAEVTCSVYPTLFKDRINIHIAGDDVAHYRTTFYSLEGKMMLSLQSESASIDTSRLPSGTYIVETTDGNKCFTSKAVKL